MDKQLSDNDLRDLLVAGCNDNGVSVDVVFDTDVANPDNGRYISIWQGQLFGGTHTYHYSDNSTEWSNLGCPEFTDVQDAMEWVCA